MKKIDKNWMDENFGFYTSRLVGKYLVDADDLAEVRTHGENWSSKVHGCDTHKAYIIKSSIHPIEPQHPVTALLDEILSSNNRGDIMGWNELHDKIGMAKKLLEGE